MSISEDLQYISKELWNDRVGFFKHILRKTPTEQQGDALIALDNHDHVSISSGHGCGKSFIEAGSGLHYMVCRPFPKVPCTAPSKHQLHDVLWAELSMLHRGMNPVFRNMFQWTKENFFHKEHPEEWFMAARTATKEKPESLQGFHAKYVFRIADEASGIPEAVFEVLEGAHGRLETKELLCANPTRRSGTFYESHHRMKQFYKRFVWSVLDSPVAPPNYAERMAKKWGESSNMYRVRVLGLFPLRDDETYIPYDLAIDALHRDIIIEPNVPKVFGVDVARYGDDKTVIAIRQGDQFLPYYTLNQKSTMETAGYVARLANKHKPHHIFVDVNGLGAGVYDRLEEQGFPVVPVNVSESPAIDGLNYNRLRDELWGLMRDWLETRRGKLWDEEPDLDLVGELTTPTFKITSNGKIVIESKDQMKSRGFQSPNIADAHIMTFALPGNEYTRDQEEEEVEEEDHTMYALDPEAGY